MKSLTYEELYREWEDALKRIDVAQERELRIYRLCMNALGYPVDPLFAQRVLAILAPPSEQLEAVREGL